MLKTIQRYASCFSVLALVLALGSTPARAELLVVDSSANAVRMYDETTGQFLGNFADNTGIEQARQLGFPRAAALASNGALFVSGFDSFAVLRYTSIGGNRGKFADSGNSPSFGQPTGVALRLGFLYAVDPGIGNIKRYDTSKDRAQAFDRVFASGNGLNNPEGITFGPDGNLYVANQGGGNILRFNGTTGAFISALTNGASGLSSPMDLTFGPDGLLYVVDPSLTGKVLRFNPATGAFANFFVNNDANLTTPRAVAFGEGGKLHVAEQNGGSVRVYSSAGVFEKILVQPGAGGLESPTDLIFRVSADGTKLNLGFHWWGILALTMVLGGMQLRYRRQLALVRKS